LNAGKQLERNVAIEIYGISMITTVPGPMIDKTYTVFAAI